MYTFIFLIKIDFFFKISRHSCIYTNIEYTLFILIDLIFYSTYISNKSIFMSKLFPIKIFKKINYSLIFINFFTIKNENMTKNYLY